MSSASIESSSQTSKRYHDLDAFRAWAVLLGIVLHVAWLMLPYRLATPIVDGDNHPTAAWLFTFIHFFRMQAFFLVAGFFANLVYTKRGLWSFTKNRVLRIGVPLVVGAVLFVPWMRYYHAWGGIVGGGTLSDSSVYQLWIQDLQTTYSQNIPLVHLWFLYDLLLLYVATILVKLAMDFAFDRKRVLRSWIQRKFCSVLKSSANVLILAIPSALLLLPMKYWLGLEGYPTWLVPDWYGFAGYWLFFLVGWMLYFNQELLQVFSHRWKTFLLLGLFLSFPIWGLYEHHVRAHVNGFYPAIGDSSIVDYPKIRSQLLTAADASDRTTAKQKATYEIWQSLESRWQKRIRNQERLNTNQLQGFGTELTTKVVFAKPLSAASEFQSLSKFDTEDASIQNREFLGLVFHPAITDKLVHSQEVWILKATFSVFYAITMWLLVFGFMGLFQTYFRNPSPAVRYLSDSSYWLYLLHLPILFWLAMYLSPLELGFVGKFAAYNLLAVLILLPSYHYLVRSTPLGWLLNGRSYPYRPFFKSDLFAPDESTSPHQGTSPSSEQTHIPSPAILRKESGAQSTT